MNLPSQKPANPIWHSLADKCIWITGGAGYLGSAITAALDRCCRKVVCFDLPGRSDSLVAQSRLERTVPISLDVAETSAILREIDSVIDSHGLPDGIAYLATSTSRGRSLLSLTAGEFGSTFERGLTPTFVFCRALAERMKLRGSGSFVLFASMYGMVAPDPRIYRPPMTPNPIDYGAAKAALIQLMRYFAVHYGPDGLRFNCVTPGAFPNHDVQKSEPQLINELSQKAALGRIGDNSEIVGPTLFLLADSASFVTGHSLVVDGGWTAW